VRILAGGAVILLLIGCGNAANLLLARLVSRKRELAVRAAHGATRARLASLLAAESLFLAALGGAVGLLLAVGVLALLRQTAAPPLPSAAVLRLDGRLLLVSVGLTLAAGILTGLGAALLGSRVDLREDLVEGARGSESRGRRSAARALVVAEVALAIVLMSGAGLLAKGPRQLTSADPRVPTGQAPPARGGPAGGAVGRDE